MPEISSASPFCRENPSVDVAPVSGQLLSVVNGGYHGVHRVNDTSVIGEVRSSKVYRSSSSLHHASTAIC